MMANMILLKLEREMSLSADMLKLEREMSLSADSKI